MAAQIDTLYLLGAFAEADVIALSQGRVPDGLAQHCREVLNGACVDVPRGDVAARAVSDTEPAVVAAETGAVESGGKVSRVRRRPKARV